MKHKFKDPLNLRVYQAFLMRDFFGGIFAWPLWICEDGKWRETTEDERNKEKQDFIDELEIKYGGEE